MAQKRYFSRVAKLASLFGYGASSPYNPATIRGLVAPTGFAPYHDPNASSGPGGNVHDWYSQQIQIGQDFHSQIADWNDMVSYSPIAGAIRVIMEECIQAEHSAPGTLWVEGGDSESNEELNTFIKDDLECEEVIRPQFWNIIVYGNNFEKLLLGPNGVHGWMYADLVKVKRIVDEDRRIVGFQYDNEDPPEGRAVIWGRPDTGSNKGHGKKLWKPWDFVHMRLMGSDRATEYGTSILKPATQVYKKLKMAEDQMITYRLQMQPSRYLFMLDTGVNPPTDIGQIINNWKNFLRSSRHMDPDKNIMETRYDPWALDDILIIPRRTDSTSSFEKMDGDVDVPDITDVQFLLRQLAGMLNIPPEFLGVEPEGGSNLSSKSALAVQDLRFQRTVKTLRNPVMQGYDTICRIHLALQNKNPYIPFRVRMSNISALESESQMELTSAQAELADRLIQLGQNIDAPQEEWIRMVFTKYMPLPDEMVDIVSIGSTMKSDEDHEPLPSGPLGDLGFGDEGGGEDEGFELPETPPEPAAPIEEKMKFRKRMKFLFHPKVAAARYAYRKSLLESKLPGIGKIYESVSKPESLLETRKRISESIKESFDTVWKNPETDNSRRVRSAIRKIIRITEGYDPIALTHPKFISSVGSKPSQLLVDSRRKKLIESLNKEAEPKEEKNSNPHEFVKFRKKAAKK